MHSHFYSASHVRQVSGAFYPNSCLCNSHSYLGRQGAGNNTNTFFEAWSTG